MEKKINLIDGLKSYVLNRDINKTFSQSLINYSEEVRKEMGNIGLTPQETIIFRSSDLFGFINDSLKGTQVRPANYSFSRRSGILQKVNYYEELKNTYDSICPYVDFNNYEWREVGYSPEQSNPILTSQRLTPHRIVARINVSRTLFKQNEDFQKQFIGILVKGMEDKVINSMLTDTAGGSFDGYNYPEGIFYNIPRVEVASVDDIFYKMKDLDRKNINCEWLFSGGAKTDLINLTQDFKIMDGEKLFGSPLNIEPLYGGNWDCFAYLDFSKIVVANWGYYGITVDDITEAHKNNVILTVEGYFDYKALDKDCIKVFHIPGEGHREVENGCSCDCGGAQTEPSQPEPEEPKQDPEQEPEVENTENE